MKRGVYIVLLVIFVAVFLVSGYFLGSYLLESGKQKAVYDNLAQMVENRRNEIQRQTQQTQTVSPGAEGDSDSADPTEPTVKLVTITDPDTGEEMEILPEYAEVYLMNTDLVGWIQIPDTNINYPVMQSTVVKNYYLYVNFKNEYSNHGSIYVREECDVTKPSDNVTIYGHHTSVGTMFGNLDKFVDKNFWEEHKTFTFDTLTEYHTYEIIAVFRTSANIGEGFAYHHFVDAANEAEFDEFVATCKSLAYYDTGLTAEYGDKLICLSTCEYTLNNGRLVVLAKRIS